MRLSAHVRKLALISSATVLAGLTLFDLYLHPIEHHNLIPVVLSVLLYWRGMTLPEAIKK